MSSVLVGTWSSDPIPSHPTCISMKVRRPFPQPNFTTFTKFHNVYQILQFLPTFTKCTEFDYFDKISQLLIFLHLCLTKYGFLQMVLPMFGYSHDHGFLWFGVAPLAWPWPWLSIYRGGALYHIAMQSKNL